MDLSVVIPVRDGADVIRNQLQALTDQTFDGAWEVVVADNGSTDDLQLVLAEFSNQLQELRRIDASGRRGAAHARNAGAAAAYGESLVFVDADDVVCPNYLSAMNRALHATAVVGANQIPASLMAAHVTPSRLVPGPMGDSYGFWPSSGGALAIRKRDFELLGGFDEDLLAGEDIDFWWRAHLAALSVAVEHEAAIQIHMRPGVRNSFRRGRTHGRAGPKLYRKYRVHGMPRRSWRSVIRFYGGLLTRLPRIRSRTDLDAWMFLAGHRVGLVEGSLRQRVLYL